MTDEIIRVVIADDHPVVRAGLRTLVESQPGLEVVADFASPEKLLSWLATEGAADIILLDLRFGPDHLSGIEATAQIRAFDGPPVIILTTYDTDVDVVGAIEAGAGGYLLKDAPTDELAHAIRSVARGNSVFGPSVQRRLVARTLNAATSLSPRELEVLAAVSRGATNEMIAKQLVVSLATVKTHLSHIFDKLHASSRTEAVAVARQRGLIAD